MDEKYFVAKITTDMVDSESGKVKKTREEKLVKGYSPTDVEAKVTKIKINEIINIIQVPAKTAKITDNDLVDLLQYYDLINELETVNGKN